MSINIYQRAESIVVAGEVDKQSEGDLHRKITADAITQLVEEVALAMVQEDEPTIVAGSNMYTAMERNQLREEQRQTLKAMMGGDV